MSTFIDLIKQTITPRHSKQQILKLESMGFESSKIEKYMKIHHGDIALVMQSLKRNKKKKLKKTKQRKKKKRQINTNTIDPDQHNKKQQISTHQTGEKVQKLAPKPEAINVHCSCGSAMKLRQLKECEINTGLKCNHAKCLTQIQPNQWFYDCTRNASNASIHERHSNYCIQCANLNMLLLRKTNQTTREHESEIKTDEIQQNTARFHDIYNGFMTKIQLLNHDPQTMTEKYGLNDEQTMLLYLIPDEMHQHAAIWIKATNANAALLHEYSEICKQLFTSLEMEQFPIFTGFGCSSIRFDLIPNTQKYALQRILIILATFHISLSYCPQIVHLANVLVKKMDEKCVFALCHSMLNVSKHKTNHKNMYFTFNYLSHSVRIHTLLTLIRHNIKAIDAHLKQNNISITKMITKAMESMFVSYLSEETYLTLIDMFVEKGYSILFKIAVSLIKNCQKNLVQATNISAFKRILKKYSKSITPNYLNSWMFLSLIFWNMSDESLQYLDDLHKNDRAIYVDEYLSPAIIRIWPKWERAKMIACNTEIFIVKWMYFQMWIWLPPRCHLGEFRLLFNATSHGYKLMSLYYHVMNHENLVIIIRSRANEIFGAFVSSIGYEQHWRNFLADHKAFVFVLRSIQNEECVKKKIEFREAVLSVLPRKDSLSIVYGKSNLISINEALQSGFCEKWKEGESPLCGDENGQFDIASIEAWSVEDDFQVARKQKESIHSLCENHLQQLSTVLFGGRQHNHAQYSSF